MPDSIAQLDEALQARTLISQPFWLQLREHALGLERAAQQHLYDARWADEKSLRGLHQRWAVTREVVESILRYPEAVIQAAKDASQKPSDWRSGSAEIAQQGEQWQ